MPSFISAPTLEVASIDAVVCTGGTMAGMTVTVVWDTGTEVVTWVATSGSAGEVVGNGWRLHQTGDTFTSLWTFEETTGFPGVLQRVTLDGRPGGVVFDHQATPEGTPGSAFGREWSSPTGAMFTVAYQGAVNVTGSAAAGDLYHTLILTGVEDDFGSLAPTTTWTFYQDADNIVPVVAPPPPPPPPPPAPAPCVVPAGPFPHGGYATIGGFLVPAVSGACPAPEATPQRTADTEESATAAASYRDYGVVVPIGRPADRFTITIESVGADPLYVGGAEWTGWLFNNMRRI